MSPGLSLTTNFQLRPSQIHIDQHNMSTYASITVGSQKSNLPILVGQSNFRRWYKAWFIALRGARYWSVINDGIGKETRPVQSKDERYDDY